MTLGELLQKCRTGNELAWEKFVRDYQGRIYRIAYTYVRDADEARDLAQDVFVRIYQSLDKCRPDSNPLAWVITITRNMGVDYTRRRKRRPPMRDIPVEDAYGLASSGMNPEEIQIAESRKKLLHRALNSLTAISREIILLKDLQGLALHEIASMLNIPLGTAKSRSNRARLELTQAVLAISGGSRS